MFRNLIMKSKNFNLKKIKNKIFCSYPTFILDQKLFIIFVLQINFLHKLYFHVFYGRPINSRSFKNLA